MKVEDIQRPPLWRRFLLIELVIGLLVTWKHLWKSNVTEQYPKERPTFRTRFRSVPRLRDHEDKPKPLCIGCGQCANVCPTNCITVVSEARKEGKGKQAKLFYIDYERCCVCGLCVDACPTKPVSAIYMSHDYELAKYDRDEFMTDKELLYTGHPRKEYKK